MDGQGEEQPQQQYPFTMPSVLNVIEQEWAKFERDRSYWQLEKDEMQAKLAYLTEQNYKQEGLKRDLIRRIKMLEAAILEQRTMSNKLANGTDGEVSAKVGRDHRPHNNICDDEEDDGIHLNSPVSDYINESRLMLVHALKTLGIQDNVVKNKLRVGVNPVSQQSHARGVGRPLDQRPPPPPTAATASTHLPHSPATTSVGATTAAAGTAEQPQQVSPRQAGGGDVDAPAPSDGPAVTPASSSSGGSQPDDLDLGELADLGSLANLQEGAGSGGANSGNMEGSDGDLGAGLLDCDPDDNDECDDDEDDDDDLFYDDLNSELVDLDRNMKGGGKVNSGTTTNMAVTPPHSGSYNIAMTSKLANTDSSV